MQRDSLNGVLEAVALWQGSQNSSQLDKDQGATNYNVTKYPTSANAEQRRFAAAVCLTLRSRSHLHREYQKRGIFLSNCGNDLGGKL
jgi:hypothetical protein